MENEENDYYGPAKTAADYLTERFHSALAEHKGDPAAPRKAMAEVLSLATYFIDGLNEMALAANEEIERLRGENAELHERLRGIA